MKKKKLENGWSLSEAVQENIFCEPDVGVVNMEAIMEFLTKFDFDGWAIVEQDIYPAPFDKPLPIAKHTREYLEYIGMTNRIGNR